MKFILSFSIELRVRQNFCGAQEPEDGVDENCFGLLHLIVDLRRAGVEGHGVEVGEVAEAVQRFVAEGLRGLGTFEDRRVFGSYQDDLKMKENYKHPTIFRNENLKI